MRRFAVIGSPIGHSLSPILHSAAYRALGIEDAHYGRIEVPAGALADFLGSAQARELEGLSVTMPGKPEAFALASAHDAISDALEVSNTLLRRPDGSWRAENHDVHGIAAALADHGASAVAVIGVLGSGATAASALAAGARMGAARALVSARDPQRAQGLVELGQRLSVAVDLVPWERSDEVLEADAVVSALSLPGAEAVASAWAGPSLPAELPVLLDALYDPWPPPLAALLAQRGAEVASGLEMLVHQADMQLRSMLGIAEAPREAMLAAARAELRGRASARTTG